MVVTACTVTVTERVSSRKGRVGMTRMASAECITRKSSSENAVAQIHKFGLERISVQLVVKVDCCWTSIEALVNCVKVDVVQH